MIENGVPQTFEKAKVSLSLRVNPLRRILVVEDEPDIRRLNAEVLQSSGYEVHTAEDGNAGWKALHAVRHAPDGYDLLLTDHQMPGMTGLTLVKNMRAARMALPVVMATGELAVEDLTSRYSWLQPAIMLIKPYSIRALVGTVEAVLNTTGAARKLITPTSRPGPLAAINFS